ncbi:hypothetical protein BXZ70DRAFT_1003942 [Cristinia sonorae]|uniref:Uncharacterized protein n=1 Tax=Cristinia sonorae TaxID=1940300 RepID=A0A8K0UYQ6_9AGAR|nr:hypothetical protein BXZ70DRAFT_1003942 [Cristinia sonorae]
MQDDAALDTTIIDPLHLACKCLNTPSAPKLWPLQSMSAPKLIPQPKKLPDSLRTAYPPESTKQSLLQQMGVYYDVFEEFTSYVRAAVHEELDLTRTMGNQKPKARASFFARVRSVAVLDPIDTAPDAFQVERYPLMGNYERAWPASAYVSRYFSQARRKVMIEKGELAKNGPVRTSSKATVRKTIAPPTAGENAPTATGSTSTRKLRSSTSVDNKQTKKSKQTHVLFVDIASSNQTDPVRAYLRSLQPPQEALLPVLTKAGLCGQDYLKALARNPGVRDGFLKKLESTGRVTELQLVILEEGFKEIYNRLDGNRNHEVVNKRRSTNNM